MGPFPAFVTKATAAMAREMTPPVSSSHALLPLADDGQVLSGISMGSRPEVAVEVIHDNTSK
jgi:hypothetical protein